MITRNDDSQYDCKNLLVLILAAVFAVLSTVSDAWAGWTYDATGKTVTDGCWTFDVTKVSGTSLTVTGSTGSFTGTEGRPVDFTDIRDASVTAYQVVEFGGFSRRAQLHGIDIMGKQG